MNRFPGDLNFIALADTVIRVEAPASGALVGYITQGYLNHEASCVRSSNRWFVDGHDYISFKTVHEAAWALRDYYLTNVIRGRVIQELRSNDGAESVVQRMKRPKEEHRVEFKRRTRSDRGELFDDLADANSKVGGSDWTVH